MSKFGEAFVHVAWSFSSVQTIYDVLFALDCLNFIYRGHAITGVQWKKTAAGPFPVEGNRISAKIIELENPLEGGIRVCPVRGATWVEFSADEVETIDECVKHFAAHPSSVQELVKAQPGFEVAFEGEVVPISTSLVHTNRWRPSVMALWKSLMGSMNEAAF